MPLDPKFFRSEYEKIVGRPYSQEEADWTFKYRTAPMPPNIGQQARKALSDSLLNPVTSAMPAPKVELEPKKEMGDTMRGWHRGVETLQATGYGALGLAGSVVGADKLKDYGFRKYQENIKEAEKYPKETDFFNIRSPKQALTWAKETTGELAPSMIEALVTGGIGAFAGGATGSAVAPGPGTVAGSSGGLITGVLGKSAIKHMIKETAASFVEKGIAKKAALEMAKAHVEKIGASAITKRGLIEAGKRIGSRAGIVAGVAPIEAGGNWAENMENGIDNPVSAIATGLAAGFLEIAGGNIRVLDKVLGKQAVDVAEKAIKEKKPGIVSRIFKEAITQAPAETLQEMGQEFLSLVNVAVNDPSFEMFTLDNLKRLGESGAAGMLGGAIGGISGAFEGRKEQTGEKKQTVTPPPIVPPGVTTSTGTIKINNETFTDAEYQELSQKLKDNTEASILAGDKEAAFELIQLGHEYKIYDTATVEAFKKRLPDLSLFLNKIVTSDIGENVGKVITAQNEQAKIAADRVAKAREEGQAYINKVWPEAIAKKEETKPAIAPVADDLEAGKARVLPETEEAIKEGIKDASAIRSDEGQVLPGIAKGQEELGSAGEEEALRLGTAKSGADLQQPTPTEPGGEEQLKLSVRQKELDNAQQILAKDPENKSKQALVKQAEDNLAKLQPKKEEAAPTQAAKEPWTVTQKEFISQDKSRFFKDLEPSQVLSTKPEDQIEVSGRIHKIEVQRALKSGKPVPPEVLAEYPDLTAPKAPVAASVEPGKAMPKEISSILNDTAMSFREKSGALIKLAKDGKMSKTELGKAISEIPPDSPSAKRPVTTATSALDRYESGEIKSIDDLVSELKDTTKDKNILSAIDEYEQAKTVDRNKYGMRSGLPEEAGDRLVSRLKQMGQPEPVSPEKKVEVLPEKSKAQEPLTLDKFLTDVQKDMNAEDFESVKNNLIEDHYNYVEIIAKDGDQVPRVVFDSLKPDKQKHFLKHYGERAIEGYKTPKAPEGKAEVTTEKEAIAGEKYPWEVDDNIYPPGISGTPQRGYEVLFGDKYTPEVRVKWAEDRIKDISNELKQLHKTAATAPNSGAAFELRNNRSLKTQKIRTLKLQKTAWEKELATQKSKIKPVAEPAKAEAPKKYGDMTREERIAHSKQIKEERDEIAKQAMPLKTPTFTNKEGTKGSIIHPSTKSPGKWQMTTWDERGFFGDTTHNSKEEAIQESFLLGYKKIDTDGVFKKVSTSKEFNEGIRKTEEAQKRWKDAQAQMDKKRESEAKPAPVITTESTTEKTVSVPMPAKKADALKPKGEQKETEKIEDFGEKIGGARKDTADRGFTKGTTTKEDESVEPWRKKYIAMKKVDGSGWTLGKSGDKWGISSSRAQVFPTQEAAEKAIPLYAVAESHRVYEDEKNKHHIYKIVGKRKWLKVVNQTFPSREEGMKYMAEHAEELLNTKTSFGEEILPVPEIAKRTGVERRTKDATPEMFMETFAPRGIEFGNWNNQEERQQVLNHAYDGLLDLAEVLNIPPKALMLNGELAIAFGARGQGLSGAKAHYEPTYGVINLTKMKGAGSLAHEWFHALDHYFGRQDTKAPSEKAQNKRGDMVYKDVADRLTFLSHGASYKSKVRPELQEAYKDLMEGMYRKAEKFVEDTQQADKFVATTRNNLKEKLDSIRKDLEKDYTQTHTWRKNKKGLSAASAEQLAEFDRLSNILIEGGDLKTEIRFNQGEQPTTTEKPKGVKRSAWGRMMASRHSNDTLDALSKIYKAVRNRTGFDSQNQQGAFDSVGRAMNAYSQRLNMLKEAQNKTEKTKRVPTSYAMEAKKMDQARTGDYWSEPHEMAARAFSSFVEDKIAEQGNQSDFIVYHAHGGILLPMIDGFVARPYPEGNERKSINEAFDKLVNMLQTKETNKGAALFQRNLKGDRATEIWNAEAEKVLANLDKEVVYQKNAHFMDTLKQLKDAYAAIGEPIDLQDAEAIKAFYSPITNQIYINKDLATKDTIFHEYTHPVLNWIKANRSVFYNKGLSLVKDSPYHTQAINNGYKKGEEALNEALAQAIGERGAQIQDAALQSRFKVWLARIAQEAKRILKKLFNVDMTLDDFINNVAYGMREGKYTAEGQRQDPNIMRQNIAAQAETDLYEDNVSFIKDRLPALLKAIIKRPGLTQQGKKDLSYFGDLLLSVPQYFKDNIYAVGQIYKAASDRVYNRHEMVFGLETHENQNIINTLKALSKRDKAQYISVKNYLLDWDRSNTSYKVKPNEDGGWDVTELNGTDIKSNHATEAEAIDASLKYEKADLKTAGKSEEFINAVEQVRITTNKVFELLAEDMRKLIAQAKESGFALPDITYTDQTTGEIVKIKFEEAMARIGDFRGSYFPRIRQKGNYVLIATDPMGDDNIRKEYLTQASMNADADIYRKQGYKVETKQADQLGEDVFEMAGSMVKTQQIITDALDKLKSTTNEAEISAAYKEIENVFIANVANNIADVIKGRGSRGHMIKRAETYWRGFETDPIKALSMYIQSVAGGVTKREMMQKMFKALTGTEMSFKEMKAVREFDGNYEEYLSDEKTVANDFITEEIFNKYNNPDEVAETKSEIKALRAQIKDETDEEILKVLKKNMLKAQNKEYELYRNHVKAYMIEEGQQKNAFKWAKAFILENTRNREAADEIMGTLHGLAVGKYLAFRVFAAPLVNLSALPTTATATMNAAGIPINKALKSIGEYSAKYIAFRRGKKLSEADQWVFKYIKDKGWDNAQFNHETMTALRSQMGNAGQKIIDIGMWTFSESERLNRAATISAAFTRLSQMPEHKDKSKEEIADLALEISNNAHGVYGRENRPYVGLGGNPAAQTFKMFYVFRTFAHNYLLNMRRMGYNGNYKALAYMVVSPAVLAGAGASIAMPVITMLLKAFGIDDPEEEVYEKIGKNFGIEAEQYARHGLLGAGGKGVAIKGSLSIGIGDLPTTIGDLLGAPGSVLKDLGDAAMFAYRGDAMKSFEKAAPTGFGNLVRAYRESTEGATTWTNAPKFFGREQIKLSPVEAFYRTLSFNPARINRISEIQYSDKKLEQKYKERRDDIFAKFKRYWINGLYDESEYANLLAEVSNYNEDAGQASQTIITPKLIRMAYKRAWLPPKRERERSLDQIENDYNNEDETEEEYEYEE